MSDRSHPNVVFIVGDNVGWGDIGCYGGLAPTPRIDALASQGLRFKNLIEKRLDCGWVLAPVAARMGALQQSVARYPNIKPGQEFTGYK